MDSYGLEVDPYSFQFLVESTTTFSESLIVVTDENLHPYFPTSIYSWQTLD